MDNIEFSRGIAQETLLTISNLAAQAENWKDKLDKIIQFTRPYFIFDNIVIYFTEIETNRVDVLYARATGRGKSNGADISWGESIANKVITEKTNDPRYSAINGYQRPFADALHVRSAIINL